MKKTSCLICALSITSATLLSACISEEDSRRANTVITALPQEIEGCSFLGDVDGYASPMMSGARFNLKLEAANLNATHVVETFAVPVAFNVRSIGVMLSGRAYRCPAGKGPLQSNEQALIQYQVPGDDYFFPDNVAPRSHPRISAMHVKN